MQVAALELLVSAFLAAASAAPASEAPVGQGLVAFEIVDQFGDAHTDKAFREGVFVVVGSDREGSAFSADWSEAIKESLEVLADSVDLEVTGLAHVHGVPRFVRGLVRKQFPREPDAWVLLDWKGVFETAYGYEKDSTTILVFVDGTLVHRTHGREVEVAEVAGIRGAVEAALERSAMRTAEWMAVGWR